MYIKRKITRLSCILAGLLLGVAVPSVAQDGETIFKQNCAACHTVGKGRLVGPDLAGITSQRPEEWLIKWTRSSQTLIKSGDADAKAIFDEYNGLVMPDQNLPDADIKAIFAFVASKEAAAPAATSAPAEPATNASNHAMPEEIAQGRNIFVGSQRLINGGPSCISCHNISYKGIIPGGLLAKDLTTVYSRFGGDAGIQGILGAPPFPAMTEAYKNKPMTEKEIANLTAFFNKVDKDKAGQQVSAQNPLLYGGAAGFVVLILLYSLIWVKRKRFTVKRDIYLRQLKSI